LKSKFMSSEMNTATILSTLKEAFVPRAPTLDALPESIREFRMRQDATKERAHDHLYVTDFTYKPCMRRLAYILLRPDIRDKAKDAKTLFKMDSGTAIHAWFQENLLGPMGALYGQWECSRCGNIELGPMPQKPCARQIKVLDPLSDKWIETKCKDIGAPEPDGTVGTTAKIKKYKGMKWLFKEQRIVLNYHGIEVTGRHDGLLVIVGDKLLEIKSTDSERFAALDGPKDYHVFQASVYAAKLGYDELILMHIDQGDWSNIKAYPVKADPAALTMIENYCETIRFLVDHKDPLRALPPCNKRSAWKARECGCKDICFPLKKKAVKKKSGKKKSGKKKER
jgi:hypothetical protein